MPESFSVRLAKEQFVFSAAHFITMCGDRCEHLHGHNYRVELEVFGPLDENQYVVDFIATRDAMLRITSELDHRVMLPTEHPMIHVEASDLEVTARFQERRWVFPREDCVLLPVANTTSELLARYIGLRLEEAFASSGFRPAELVVGIDECEGQYGVWRKTCD